jgi:hypothetical protein
LDVLEKKKVNTPYKNQTFSTYEQFESYINEYFRQNYWVMMRSKAERDKNKEIFERIQFSCHMKNDKIK